MFKSSLKQQLGVHLYIATGFAVVVISPVHIDSEESVL